MNPADIRWQEPWSVRCPVCDGDGVEAKPPRKPRIGKYVIEDDPEGDEAYTNSLINRWNLNDEGA